MRLHLRLLRQVRALLTEVIGAVALVFAGCGAVMVDARTHQLDHLGVALAFGEGER